MYQSKKVAIFSEYSFYRRMKNGIQSKKKNQVVEKFTSQNKTNLVFDLGHFCSCKKRMKISVYKFIPLLMLVPTINPKWSHLVKQLF